MNRSSLKWVLCLLLPLLLAAPVVQAGVTIQPHALVKQKQKTTKKVRFKPFKKIVDQMTSKTKGIVSLVAGGLTILSLVLTFNFLIASVPIALPIITMLLVLGFGVGAVVFGFQAVKEDNQSKGLGLAGMIIGGLGALFFIAWLIAFSQFSFN